MPGAGKPFKKGNKAAEGKGRPQVPPELKAARKLTRPQVELVFTKYLHATPAEVDAVLASPDTPFIDRIVLAIAQRALDDGDQAALNFMLDRTIGKVKDHLEVTTSTPFIIRRPSGETVELGVKPKEIEE